MSSVNQSLLAFFFSDDADPGPNSAVSADYGYPIGSWNVSQVTDFSGIFHGLIFFNEDISQWDTASATTTEEMFRNAQAFNQPVEGWEVARVTNMAHMFRSAAAFNQPLQGWDVGNVKTMEGTFRNALAFNQPLEGWNVSQVTTMEGMLRYTPVFNQPLAGWDISRVTMMRSLFEQATAFDQDLSGWDLSYVREARGMFLQANHFSQDLCSWGPKMQQSVSFEVAFLGSGCPKQASPNLMVEPRGPFCFDCGSPQAPGEERSSVWEILDLGIGIPDDSCILEDNCIASHAGVGLEDYKNIQVCGFVAIASGTLVVEYFDTEEGHDIVYLHLPGKGSQEESYSGTNARGLDDRSIPAGAVIAWLSNTFQTGKGWKLCLNL